VTTKTKEIKMVNIRLSPDLWHKVKVKATLNSKTLQDFVTETLEQAVK